MTTIRTLDLPNRIKNLDEPTKAALQIDQNFEAIVNTMASIITWINDNSTIADGMSEFEANAITCGAEEPT
jgi:hypothetical protein